MKEFVRRSTYAPFRRFIGGVRDEFMHYLYVVLHGTLGSYLRDALEEGGALVVPYLPACREQLYVTTSLYCRNHYFVRYNRYLGLLH
jgi:hypothetical protein